MHIYIYIYIYIYVCSHIYTYVVKKTNKVPSVLLLSANDLMATTALGQMMNMIYYTHLISAGFEHFVCYELLQPVNVYVNIYIYIYIYIYIHIHVFRPTQDSSVWFGLTSRHIYVRMHTYIYV